MQPEQEIKVREELKQIYDSLNTGRSLSIDRYDKGKVLEYEIESTV